MEVDGDGENVGVGNVDDIGHDCGDIGDDGAGDHFELHSVGIIVVDVLRVARGGAYSGRSTC